MLTLTWTECIFTGNVIASAGYTVDFDLTFANCVPTLRMIPKKKKPIKLHVYASPCVRQSIKYWFHNDNNG